MEYALFYAEGVDALPYRPEDDDVGEWQDRWSARGVIEYGERLRPDQDATTVRMRGDDLLVTDGPFTESKESIGGFDIIEAADLDEAIEVAAGHPAARFGRVEIRPFVRWPDAEPNSRVVPRDFLDRPVRGRRYLMLVVAGDGDPTDDREGSDPEDWVTEMDGRRVRLFGEVLEWPDAATFVRKRDGEVLLSDGPFSESKEWIAGFDLLEVEDLAEAIEVASKHPMARGGSLELRPLWPFDLHDDHVARFQREAPTHDVRTEVSASAALAMLERTTATSDAG
jgi:hypothetical protein